MRAGKDFSKTKRQHCETIAKNSFFYIENYER